MADQQKPLEKRLLLSFNRSLFPYLSLSISLSISLPLSFLVVFSAAIQRLHRKPRPPPTPLPCGGRRRLLKVGGRKKRKKERRKAKGKKTKHAAENERRKSIRTGEGADVLPSVGVVVLLLVVEHRVARRSVAAAVELEDLLVLICPRPDNTTTTETFIFSLPNNSSKRKKELDPTVWRDSFFSWMLMEDHLRETVNERPMNRTRFRCSDSQIMVRFTVTRPRLRRGHDPTTSRQPCSK